MAVRTADRPSSTVQVHSGAVAQWGILLARLGLGFIFLAHGAQKVGLISANKTGFIDPHAIANTVGMMGHMGIPPFLAYVAIFTEFIGGLFLIFGFLSRIVGLGLIIDMAVAVALVHGKNGFFMSGGAGGPGYEYNVALIALSLLMLLSGPGALHISDWEGKILSRKGAEN